MARKTKYTPDTVKRIVDAIRLGATHELAANYGGITSETLYTWMRTKPEFHRAVKDAEGAAAAHWLAVIERAAQDGTWQAAAWKLERRYTQFYGRQIVQHEYTMPPELAEALKQKGVRPADVWQAMLQMVATKDDTTDGSQ